MSGRPKKGLDYAGWSVDMFDGDKKIDALLDAYGWKGFGIYFYLCQKAYQANGYFLEWSYADAATTARRLGGGIGSEMVSQTVNFCLQVGLFDEKVFENKLPDLGGVLTSRGIQRRYWAAINATRRVKTAYKEIWLLKSEECEGLVKVSLFSEKQQTNNHLQPTNSDLQPTNAFKRKENKTKVNNNKRDRNRSDAKKNQDMIIYFDDADLNRAFCDYIDYRKDIKKPMTKKAIDLAIGKLNSMTKNHAEAIEVLEQSVANGWTGLFPLKSGVKPAAKDVFSSFEQRDYDYAALESRFCKN